MRIVAEDSTISDIFNTKRFSTGAPYTLAGSPSMYARVDGNATEITAGFTLTVDFDSKTGQNKWELDLSASASYTAGSLVEIFIGAGTVDGVSAADTKVYEFEIGNTGSQQQANTRVMLAIPAVAPAANGGLGTVDANNAIKVQSGTGANQISLSSGAVIIQSGTGTGQLSITGGVVSANAVQVSGDSGAADNLERWFDGTVGFATTGAAVTFGDFAFANWSIGGDTQFVGEIDVAGSFTLSELLINNDLAIGGIFSAATNSLPWNAAWDAEIPTPTDVWAAASRTLTALDEDNTTIDIDGVVRAAIGMASANLDIQLAAAKTNIDAILALAGTTGVVLSAAAIDALWDEVMEGSTTARQALRLANSANGGNTDGAATTTMHLRDLANTKNRVTATVDADGNRTVTARDLT